MAERKEKSQKKVDEEVFAWVIQEHTLSAQAGVLLDLIAAVLREHEHLLFASYEDCEAVRHVAHVVQETGRTVWNGT